MTNPFRPLGTLALALGCLAAIAQESPEHRYQIRVAGPLAQLTVGCDDPCEVDQTEFVGHSGGEVEGSEKGQSSTELAREQAESGTKCTGNCGSSSQSTTYAFEGTSMLREGLKVSIKDGVAKFVFHSVVDTEDGEATLMQFSEFRIDRPYIELTLRDHNVVVETDMDESERTDRFIKTYERGKTDQLPQTDD